jgi:16S rRNA (uracil1498-N3)-methyltransferase
MRTNPAPRFYVREPIAQGALLRLPEHAAHHAQRVLRLTTGDAVRLFCGDGAEWDGELASLHKSGVSVRVGSKHAVDREAPLRVCLAQGISSRERMELTVQKAVELGVEEIIPLETRRSVVRLNEARAERRVEHWQHVVIAACEQCGRNRVPVVHPVVALPDWLGTLPQGNDAARVLLSPLAVTRLRDVPQPQHVILLAGPEGGLAPEEQEIAATCGFQPVRLGPRVLRTETAALAAMAAMQALWGDF